MEVVDSEDAMGNVKVRVECVGMDPYSCQEAIQRLNDFLDHELSESERVIVLKHLEICKSCLGRFTFEETLVVSLRQKVMHMHAPETLKQKLHAILFDQKP
jgi:mycothiol system anti-sigma-R factor